MKSKRFPLLLTLFWILVSATTTSTAQVFDILIKEYKLKGKVKNVLEQSYNVVDSAGTYKKGTIYTGRSVIDKDIAITFNEKGLLTERKRFTTFAKSASETYTYMYEKGKLKSMSRSKSSNAGPDYKELFEYDKKQQLVRILAYKKDPFVGDIDKQPFERVSNKKFVYDNDGKQVAFTDSAMQIVLQYRYNANGQKTKEKHFTPEGRLYKVLVYEYDDKGNNTSLYDSAASQTTTFRYNSGNALLESRLAERSGQELRKSIYTLDQNDNVVKHEFYLRGNLAETQTFTYRYDKFGNWIERVEIWDGKPVALKTRTITYHK